jgi:hypothetical protein
MERSISGRCPADRLPEVLPAPCPARKPRLVLEQQGIYWLAVKQHFAGNPIIVFTKPRVAMSATES